MKILISPAKKMKVDTDSLSVAGKPQFLEETEVLLKALRGLSPEERQKLWKCNQQIAAENNTRLERMDLYTQLTPAILAYEGIQYRYMAPNVFSEEEYAYIQRNLRILSGFYGILRPFDGVTPYRLEMQAKLKTEKAPDLYDFWGDRLFRALEEDRCIINLASKEYSQCISRYVSRDIRYITCTFAEEKHGKLVEKGTLCKMARGEMVRFMAENHIEDPEKMKKFDRLHYRFSEAESSADNYVYIKMQSKVDI